MSVKPSPAGFAVLLIILGCLLFWLAFQALRTKKIPNQHHHSQWPDRAKSPDLYFWMITALILSGSFAFGCAIYILRNLYWLKFVY